MPWPQHQLVSDKQMEELRKVAKLGMITTVTILRRAEGTPPADDYGDDYLTYTETNESRRTTVQGWFYSEPAQVQDVDTGMVVTTTTYRLLLPVGTDIATGDQVTVGSDEYTVSDTDTENTWNPMLTVNLRKRE
jgi:hypothetical protein